MKTFLSPCKGYITSCSMHLLKKLNTDVRVRKSIKWLLSQEFADQLTTARLIDNHKLYPVIFFSFNFTYLLYIIVTIEHYTTITYSFSSRELQTTETEDIAMARLAIQGWRVTPNGTNAPAANGIPTML